MTFADIPDGQLCQAKDRWAPVPFDNAGHTVMVMSRVNGDDGCKHRATTAWSEGAIAAIHGAYAWWCECCALDAQIRHAQQQAIEFEKMRERRLHLECR